MKESFTYLLDHQESLDFARGERELLRAIISLAVRDLLDPNSWNRSKGIPDRDFESAWEWLFEKNSDVLIPFSFAWVCEHLSNEIDPDVLQKGIIAKVRVILEDKYPSKRAA